MRYQKTKKCHPNFARGAHLRRAGASIGFVITCTICLLSLRSGGAQERSLAAPQQALAAAAELPDAPTPEGQQSSSTATSSSAKPAPTDPEEGRQTKRILWIVPNFRAVSVGTKLPPQTKMEKFKTGALDSFDYSSFIFVGIQAGIAQATNSYPEFHEGASAYGRYYWHTFADQTDENLWVEALLPTILRQDSRYYTLGHGGFFKRGLYAVSRTVITRTDSGAETFNASEVFGSGIASAISSLYYPTEARTWTKIGQRWLTNGLLDLGTFGAKEFWPDVNHAIFHQSNDD
jgi:hypothetical protein